MDRGGAVRDSLTSTLEDTGDTYIFAFLRNLHNFLSSSQALKSQLLETSIDYFYTSAAKRASIKLNAVKFCQTGCCCYTMLTVSVKKAIRDSKTKMNRFTDKTTALTFFMRLSGGTSLLPSE